MSTFTAAYAAKYPFCVTWENSQGRGIDGTYSSTEQASEGIRLAAQFLPAGSVFRIIRTKPTVSPTLRRAFQFFHANAGYIVGRAAECALSLARAEQEASSRGWDYEWKYDELGLQEWYCEGGYVPEEVLGCILRDEKGNVLASLWGIGDPDRNYRRVVEAELACEALAELRA